MYTQHVETSILLWKVVLLDRCLKKLNFINKKKMKCYVLTDACESLCVYARVYVCVCVCVRVCVYAYVFVLIWSHLFISNVE